MVQVHWQVCSLVAFCKLRGCSSLVAVSGFCGNYIHPSQIYWVGGTTHILAWCWCHPRPQNPQLPQVDWQLMLRSECESFMALLRIVIGAVLWYPRKRRGSQFSVNWLDHSEIQLTWISKTSKWWMNDEHEMQAIWSCFVPAILKLYQMLLSPCNFVCDPNS